MASAAAATPVRSGLRATGNGACAAAVTAVAAALHAPALRFALQSLGSSYWWLWVRTSRWRRSTADTGSLYETLRVCGTLGTGIAPHSLENTFANLSTAKSARQLVLNCGNCGDCSNTHDIGQYNSTLDTLTETATKCALLAFFGRGVRDARFLPESTRVLTTAPPELHRR
jgi:hypothetical protein